MSLMPNLSLEQEPESKRRKIDSNTNSSSSSSLTSSCGHYFVRYGICCNCRSTVSKHQGRSFNYLVDGLQLSDTAVAFTKKLTTQVTCLNDKKLHLVLDLDHTLLHTVLVSNLSEGEKYLLGEVDLRKDLWRFNGGHFLIKLRPFVREFLKLANEMFSMYVYTMGDRDYAKVVLKLIDPDNVYFGDRVITRNESPYVKTLDLVLVDERGVVIVDDTPQVWPEHKRNLLEITKYKYFLDTTRRDVKYSKSYAEEKRDESYKDGSLAKVLIVLKDVYEGFFSRDGVDIDSKDVRLLLHDLCIPNYYSC